MKRALALALTLGCAGATPAPRRSQAALVVRIEMLEADPGAPPDRSAACDRAIDAFGDRLGRDGVSAPDELRGVEAACPERDARAAAAALDAREGRLYRGAATPDDFEDVRLAWQRCPDCADFEAVCRRRDHERAFARVAVARLADAEMSLWLDAQRCAAILIPRRAAALTLERARAWAAAGAADDLAACLDRCTLAAPTRAELEALERRARGR
jgi:hypothetical protein